nr:MAG TPA: hypothetical protein [Caudoviricetes sp.]
MLQNRKIGKNQARSFLRRILSRKKMKHKLLNLKMHFIYFSDVVTLLCLELKSKI